MLVEQLPGTSPRCCCLARVEAPRRHRRRRLCCRLRRCLRRSLGRPAFPAFPVRPAEEETTVVNSPRRRADRGNSGRNTGPRGCGGRSQTHAAARALRQCSPSAGKGPGRGSRSLGGGPDPTPRTRLRPRAHVGPEQLHDLEHERTDDSCRRLVSILLLFPLSN